MELDMNADSNKDEPASLTVGVGGMTCPNCEVLVERRFLNLPGVRSVRASHTAGTAIIRHEGGIDLATLGKAAYQKPFARECRHLRTKQQR